MTSSSSPGGNSVTYAERYTDPNGDDVRHVIHDEAGVQGLNQRVRGVLGCEVVVGSHTILFTGRNSEYYAHLMAVNFSTCFRGRFSGLHVALDVDDDAHTAEVLLAHDRYDAGKQMDQAQVDVRIAELGLVVAAKLQEAKINTFGRR